MNNAALRNPSGLPGITNFEILKNAASVIQRESSELDRFAKKIPLELAEAVRIIHDCQGSVIVSGIGKAGWIGQKISATFASTGTRSHFMHAAEAMHGDFGRVDQEDVILILSNSGETEEVIRLLPVLKKFGAKLVSITSNEQSTLGKQCDCTIAYGKIPEVCDNGLAPSSTTTLMLSIGDALALTVSSSKQFSAMDFAKFHPGGSLGRKLQTAQEIMRPLADCRTTSAESTIRESIAAQAKQGRRTGAMLILSPAQELLGIFTDSDLVKILEQKQDQWLDKPISNFMTKNPYTIAADRLVSEAVEVLSSNCISELPVISSSGIRSSAIESSVKAIGMIDITDVIE